MKKKYSILFFAILLLNFSLFAQNNLEPKYPELFKTIPSYQENLTEWQKLLYSSNPNYFQIIKSYEEFYSSNPFEKNIHTQNYKYFLKNVSDLKFDVDEFGYLTKKTREDANRPTNKTGAIEESNNIWLQYGPNNMYHQTKPNEPFSYQVNVYSLYKSKKSEIILAMTEDSGIFISLNNGAEWRNITPNDKSNISLKYYDQYNVTIDDDTNRLYYSFQGDIFYSDDLGNSWIKIALNEQKITKMKVINSILYYTSDSGFHKIDNGKKTLLEGFTWDFLVFPKNDIIYVTKYNPTKNITEFYISKDFGLTFTLKNNGWWNPINGKAATSSVYDSGVKIASAESNPDIVYATILGEEDDNIDDKNFIGIFKSTNAGETWVNLNPSGETGGPYSSQNPCHVCSGDNGYFQGWYDFDFEILNNSNTILLGGIILKLSTDGGLTWTKPYIDHVDIQDIFVFDSNELYVASDGGINKYSIQTNTITHIKAINSGIHDSDFWGFGLGTNEISMVGGRYHNGDAYHKSSYGFGNFNKVSGVEEGTGYVNKGDNSIIATAHGGVKKMADKIEERPIILSNSLKVIPNEGYVFNSRSDFSSHPLYFNQVYFGSKNGIYKSSNFGGDSSLLFQFGQSENDLITDVRISSEDPKIMYAVQRLGYTDSKLWRSKDSGINWEELNIPIRNKLTVSIDVNMKDRLFLSSNGSTEIFISDNHGDSWSLFADLPNNIKPFYLRSVKGNDNIIFLADTYENSNVNDLFIVDGDSKLTHITSSLKNYIWIRDFEIYYPTKKIFISGAGGIWQSDLNLSLDEFVNPMVSQKKVNKGEEITFSVDTNIEKSKIKSYRWKIGTQFIESDNYFITLNSSLIIESGLLDLSIQVVKTDGSILSSKVYEKTVEIVSKIIPELFLGVNSLKFSGTPSTLNITNCKVLPLIKDNSGMVLSALDLETETLFLTHGGFLDDENIIGYDNEVFIGNFIKKSNQKILVISTSWAENTYRNFNKLYDYLKSKGDIISFDFNNGNNVNLNIYDVIIADIQSSPQPATISNLKAFIKDPNKKSILIGAGWIWKAYYSSWANENPEIYPMNIISQDLDVRFDLNNYGDGNPLGMKFYPYTLTDIYDLSLSCLDKNRNGISDKTEDDDGDGITNDIDTCPNTFSGQTVNATGCSTAQLDTDNDGVKDNLDTCPNTPTGQTVNANGCSTSQLDTDNDGVKDNLDTCPNTPTGQTVNATGCSTSQLDTDNDGVKDNLDTCPNTPSGQTVNATGCSQSQLDDDGDGIMNDKDLCPNTATGTNVNANGCFFLPANNFSIEAVGESCPDKNNGKISITAQATHNYVATINGVNHNFANNSLSVSNLSPGTYNVCIKITGVIYEQCFTITIAEGNTVSGKSSVTSNKTSIVIAEGTAPYNVFINGINVLNTESPSFTLDVRHGDLVEVKTAVLCEGVFSKTIDLFKGIIVYPNPSKGIFEITLPFSLKEVYIELFTVGSQLISKGTYQVVNGKVQLNLENKPTGVYILKIYLDTPVSLTIIKE